MIAIIVIKRKPVLTANTALKIRMWIAIYREYRGANIKLITLKEKLKNTAVLANGTQSLRAFVVMRIQNGQPIFGV